jgi:hypothetical protein
MHTCHLHLVTNSKEQITFLATQETISVVVWNPKIALGCVMVSMLATGLEARGFNHGLERWVFKGEKIRSTPSFRRGSKAFRPVQ